MQKLIPFTWTTLREEFPEHNHFLEPFEDHPCHTGEDNERFEGYEIHEHQVQDSQGAPTKSASQLTPQMNHEHCKYADHVHDGQEDPEDVTLQLKSPTDNEKNQRPVSALVRIVIRVDFARKRSNATDEDNITDMVTL